MLLQVLRRCPTTSGLAVVLQPGGRQLGSSPARATGERLPQLPEPWRSAFLPTLPVGTEHASSNPTAFSWLRKQQPHLSLALLGKAFRQKQVRVLQQDQVKRVSRSRVLAAGDVLLFPRQLLEPAADRTDSTATHSQSQQQEHQQQQEHPVDTPLELSYQARSTLQPSHQQQQQQQQQLTQPHAEQQPQEPEQHSQLGGSLPQAHDLLTSAQQQQQQQQQGRAKSLTVQQIRKWLLASSADIAVLLKPPGVLIDLPLAQAVPPPQPDENRAVVDSSSSRGGLLDSGNSNNTHQLADSQRLQQDAVLQQPAAVFAAALNIRLPSESPQLVYTLPAGASGAVLLARHPAAAAWLRAYVSGEPAALAARVIDALGGLAAAEAALKQGAKSAAAAAVSGSTQRRAGSQSRRSMQARQGQQLMKLQQLAALAADNAAQQHGYHRQPRHNPNSSSSSSSGGKWDTDPLSCFDRQQLEQWVRLHGRLGGLRVQRVFWAVVQGHLAPQSGTLRDRCAASGLLCVTRFKVLGSCQPQGLTWLELQPLTDGPQQLRRHCAQQLEAPVLGDTRFGYQPWSTVAPSSSRMRSAGALAGARQHSSSNGRWPLVVGAASRGAVGQGPAGEPQEDSMQAEEEEEEEEELLLHAREVVLLRPHKAPVRVLAPVPKGMRSVLQSTGLM